jgi:hypothetical protein
MSTTRLPKPARSANNEFFDADAIIKSAGKMGFPSAPVAGAPERPGGTRWD